MLLSEQPHQCPPAAHRGFSLIELLCVMTIIAILAALILGASGRVLSRVKGFATEMEGPAFIEEMSRRLTELAQQQPDFPALSLDELVKQCRLSWKCEQFLRSKEVTYTPLSGRDPAEKLVLTVISGQGRRRSAENYLKSSFIRPPSE